MGRLHPPNPRLGNLEMWIPWVSGVCGSDGGGCQKWITQSSALSLVQGRSWPWDLGGLFVLDVGESKCRLF